VTGLVLYFRQYSPLHTSVCSDVFLDIFKKKNVTSFKLKILHSLTGLYKNPTEQLIGLKICLVAYVPVYFCQTSSNMSTKLHGVTSYKTITLSSHQFFLLNITA